MDTTERLTTSLVDRGGAARGRPPEFEFKLRFAPAGEPRVLRIHEGRLGERDSVVDALARSAGNQTQAARYLGVSRRTLVKRLEEFALPRPRKQLP